MRCVILSFLPCLLASETGLRAFADVKGKRFEPERYHYGPLSGSVSSSASAGTHYAIVSLNESGAVIEDSIKYVPPFQDDALMPGCNAGFDAKGKKYYKTTIVMQTFVPASGATCDAAGCGNSSAGTKCCKDPTAPNDKGCCYKVPDCSAMPVGTGEGGSILSIDIESGAVTANNTMDNPIHPPFTVYNPKDGLLYTMVPYAYTEFGLFTIDPASGNVTQKFTFPKGQLDGIAVCEGLILDGQQYRSEASTGDLLAFTMGQGGRDVLRVIDLSTGKIVNQVSGFYGPLTPDPANPGWLLAIQNVPKGRAHTDGVRLVRINPLSNATHQLVHVSNTSLGRDMRAQDQASLAVQEDAKKAWFQASYNVRNGSLDRGIFTLGLGSTSTAENDTATLIEAREAFSDGDQKPWLGRLDYIS